MSDLMEYYLKNGVPAHSKENDFAKPVYVNPIASAEQSAKDFFEI
jgi:hypothetical protein